VLLVLTVDFARYSVLVGRLLAIRGIDGHRTGLAVGGCTDVPLTVPVDDAPPLPVLPPSPLCSSPFPDVSLSSLIPPPVFVRRFVVAGACW
jgi:hypothetical protein